jgi:hypothetical protein
MYLSVLSVFSLLGLSFTTAKGIEKRQAFPSRNNFTGFPPFPNQNNLTGFPPFPNQNNFTGPFPVSPGLIPFNESSFINCPAADQCNRAADRADECFFETMNESPQEQRLNEELSQLYTTCYGMPPPDDYDMFPPTPDFGDGDYYPGAYATTTPPPRGGNNGPFRFMTTTAYPYPPFNNRGPQFFTTHYPRRGKRQAFPPPPGMEDREDMELEMNIHDMIMKARDNCDNVGRQAGCQEVQKRPCEQEIENKERQLGQMRIPALRRVESCVRRALQQRNNRNNRINTNNRFNNRGRVNG